VSVYRQILGNQPELPVLVNTLRRIFEEWSQVVLTDPTELPSEHLTRLPLDQRVYQVELTSKLFSKLQTAMESLTKARTNKPVVPGTFGTSATVLQSRLDRDFDPPGFLRIKGPRHDNDSHSISEISIIPTRQELLCSVRPFLPGNIPGAPHHCAEGTMERQLDIHFR
jgi:hypothetical protein